VNLDRAQKRVEALFKKEERAREGVEAMSEYKADVCAVREKTVRLRALRLAKEAATTRLSSPKSPSLENFACSQETDKAPFNRSCTATLQQ